MTLKSPEPTEASPAKIEVERPEGFAKEILRDTSKGLLKEAVVTLKWGIAGAVVGAALLGGAGLWKFGFTGLWVGALVGALVGGVGAVVLYTMGATLT
ncbi:MAG: putative membrane protein YeaQ/YmgE (transglycosylase-associated protein family) [Verrucomicrobiales bacterium]|jgi:uncharacterized membrane protein YeaQ/YmgE (transglycosylase-associated protein family)